MLVAEHCQRTQLGCSWVPGLAVNDVERDP